MTIVLESLATSLGGTSEVTVSKPTGTAEGDLMVAFIGTSAALSSAPSGWTLVTSDTSTNFKVWIYYKVAGASEPASYQWTFDSNTQERGVIARFSGADTSTPSDATPTTNTDTTDSPIGLSITTATDGAELLMLAYWNGSQTHTPPSGMTEEVEISRLAVSSLTQATAGASGNKTATLSASTQWSTIFWALKPAGAGGATVPVMDQYYRRLRQ